MKKLLKSKYKILGMLLMVFVPMFVWVSMAQQVEFTTTASVLPLRKPSVGIEIIPTISSSKYEIDDEQGYIYTKADVDEDTILSNITVTNGSISIVEDAVLYLSNILPLKANGIGDVNKDGVVDSADAQLLIRNFKDIASLAEEQIANADVNGDGNITKEDIRLIMVYIKNISETQSNAVDIGDKGDVDGNGIIDEEDARLILRHVAELITLEDEQIEAADVYNDGEIDAKDSRLILQYLLYNSDILGAGYDIVNISSSKYDLSGETIILEDGGVTFDVDNIIVTNGYADYDEESSTLLIYSDSDELLDEFSVENITVTPEKPEVNPGTTDMTIGNLLFIGGFVLLIIVYGLKRFKKIK